MQLQTSISGTFFILNNLSFKYINFRDSFGTITTYEAIAAIEFDGTLTLQM